MRTVPRLSRRLLSARWIFTSFRKRCDPWSKQWGNRGSSRTNLGEMRRVLHIAVSLIAVALLLRPFECFAAGTPSGGEADCCLKGKCAPTANSDACCKNSVPVRDQFVPLKLNGHVSPLIVIVSACVPVLVPSSTRRAFTDSVRHPPPRIELISPSLPLLI
jgi:hypothetical protein